MKIILLEDVKPLGKKGDVTEVADGYGRSLIGKKKAKEATAKNLNDLKLQNAHNEKVAKEQLADAKKLSSDLEGRIVTLKLKAGKEGKTFGSVSSKEIADAVKTQWGLELDKKKLIIDEPIKTLGTHDVTVKLHSEVTSTIKVKVEEA